MSLKDIFSRKKEDSGEISDFLNSLVGKVKKLSGKVASDIMLPRVDVVTAWLGQPINEFLDVLKENKYSRYPVWKEKLDNIVGILYFKDFVNYLKSSENQTTFEKETLTEDMVREPFFIPESKKIESLLKEFQSKKVHLAVVLDEYGGFAGIVTLEDIIELIVGDIQDEYDTEMASIKKITESIYEVAARATLEEVEEALKLNFSRYKEDIDTIGGVVYNILERVPMIGEEVEIDGLIYQILKKEGNKILTLKIKIPPKNTSDHED